MVVTVRNTGGIRRIFCCWVSRGSVCWKRHSAAWNQVLEANPLWPKESTAFQIIRISFSQARQHKTGLKENENNYKAVFSIMSLPKDFATPVWIEVLLLKSLSKAARLTHRRAADWAQAVNDRHQTSQGSEERQPWINTILVPLSGAARSKSGCSDVHTFRQI